MGFMSAKPPAPVAPPEQPRNIDETAMRALAEQRRRLVSQNKGGTSVTGPLGVMGKASIGGASLLGKQGY